jgi:hypothetical protein
MQTYDVMRDSSPGFKKLGDTAATHLGVKDYSGKSPCEWSKKGKKSIQYSEKEKTYTWKEEEIDETGTSSQVEKRASKSFKGANGKTAEESQKEGQETVRSGFGRAVEMAWSGGKKLVMAGAALFALDKVKDAEKSRGPDAPPITTGNEEDDAAIAALKKTHEKVAQVEKEHDATKKRVDELDDKHAQLESSHRDLQKKTDDVVKHASDALESVQRVSEATAEAAKAQEAVNLQFRDDIRELQTDVEKQADQITDLRAARIAQGVEIERQKYKIEEQETRLQALERAKEAQGS